MDIVLLIVMGFGAVMGVVAFVRAAMLGGTKSNVTASSDEQQRVLEGLGELRRTFTNYTPWRFRFGAGLLVISAVSYGVSLLANVSWLPGVAWLERASTLCAFLTYGGLVFGIPTLLYVAFMRVDRLDLHERGLVLREGKSKVTAVYYSDIKDAHYIIVVYRSGRVPKALVVELHDGGSFQIGNTFMQFGAIGGAILAFAKESAAEPDLSGTYVVTGRRPGDDEPLVVVVEATSPEHARSEALSRFGVIADGCRLRADQEADEGAS